MTLDEKIEEMKTAIERLENSAEKDHSERMFAAIAEALREERQTLKWLKDYKRLLEEALENQKTGHWIVHPKGIYAHLVCDKCLSNAPYDCRTNYCPNCGAKMEGE